MQFRATGLAEVMILTPTTHRDARGVLRECFRQSEFEAHCGHYQFVQGNLSRSMCRTLRGLHYQCSRPQGKLNQIIDGRIFNVSVDIRPTSPKYGEWVGYILNGESGELMWDPPGFCVLSELAVVHYKCTGHYLSHDEMTFHWNSNQLKIQWQILQDVTMVISDEDAMAPYFSAIKSS